MIAILRWSLRLFLWSLPFIFLGVFIGTPLGLQWSIDLAQTFVPGELNIQSSAGTLQSPITLTGITYKNAEIELVLDKISWQWSLPSIIKNHTLIFDKLTIGHLIVTQKTTTQTTTSIDPIKTITSLKKHLEQIKYLSIGNISLVQSNQVVAQLFGSLDKTWQIQWQANIQDLSTLMSDIRGSTVLHGKITGAFAQPLITNQLQFNQFQYLNQRIQSGRMDCSAQVTASTAVTCNLQATNINAPHYQINNLMVNLNSQYRNQQLQTIIRIPATRLRVLYNQGPIQLNLLTSELRSLFSRNGLTLNLTTGLVPNQQVAVQLILPDCRNLLAFDFNQRINGAINARINQLNFLNQNDAPWRILQGNAQVIGQLSGALNAPQFNGTVQLRNGQLELSGLGIVLNNIAITGTGNSVTKQINWQGQAISGGGQLRATGTSQMVGNSYNSNFQLNGTNALINNLNGIRIYANPNLSIKSTGSQLNVTGNVLIPKARITSGNSQAANYITTNDVVFVSHKIKKPATPTLDLTSAIQVTLGNDITIDIDGLTGNLSGNILVSDAPRRPTFGSGTIYILNGNYHAYGQDLKLQKGAQIIFTGGDITNPVLDIQAARRVAVANQASAAFTQSMNLLTTNPRALLSGPGSILSIDTNSILVGVNVSGTLNNPQYNLFSQPAILSQSDILSYLVLGKPTSQATGADASLLFRAASALAPGGGGQFSHIVQQLQSRFSLDELGIQSTPQITPGSTQVTQNTSLVLGKALSPRLYVNYSIGLLVPVNTMKVSYFLSKHWRVQTESNTQDSGADVLYTIEK